MPPLRLLTFSTLYPSAARPSHGVFVENRLRQLVGSGRVTSTVLAPVPWFPSTNARFGDWARLAATPRRETRHGLSVLHPRFPVIPRVGMTLAPYLLYHAMVPVLRRLLVEVGPFDAIDAHYVYPDGVAAVWLGQKFRLPVVVTARGTDLSLIPRYRLPRLLIGQVIRDAAALITVSAALKDAFVALGAPPAKVTVLRNGVDIGLFRPPADRALLRESLGFRRPTLISVGLLIERKGHHRTIEAMTRLPDFDLVIVGAGPEQQRLVALIARLGLGDRVRLLGAHPHETLAELYGAADASVLSSSREGWANVLLESMACGTPVVASNIWGNPEVVRGIAAGVITDDNTPEGIAGGVRRLFSDRMTRGDTRAYAEQFGWGETTQGQIGVFSKVLGRSEAATGSDGGDDGSARPLR
jgi:glycosyltransferase involved in cell wall biosynthesis